MPETGDANRSVVITGAAGDLGRSLCESFMADGLVVYAADIKIQPRQERLVPVEIDVSNRTAVNALAARVEQESRLTVWINAAGIFLTGAVAEAADEDWHRIIAVNLTGTFYGCAAAMPILVRAGGGRIINVGSVSGQIGGVGVHPAYGASKAGIHALTRTYALEGGRKNVLCNAVAPGLLEGTMIEQFGADQMDRMNRANPLRRAGTMREVASVIRFLAGPEATYLNGAIIPVNGGAFMP